MTELQHALSNPVYCWVFICMMHVCLCSRGDRERLAPLSRGGDMDRRDRRRADESRKRQVLHNVPREGTYRHTDRQTDRLTSR